MEPRMHKVYQVVSIDLFKRWKTAGKDAEMHVYGDGRGPFGIGIQGSSSESWPESFMKWLEIRQKK